MEESDQVSGEKKVEERPRIPLLSLPVLTGAADIRKPRHRRDKKRRREIE